MKKSKFKSYLKQFEAQIEELQRMKKDLHDKVLGRELLKEFDKFLWKNNRKVCLWFRSQNQI